MFQECELCVRQSGSAFVLDGGFEVIYSVLAQKENAGAESRGAAFRLLETGLAALERELDRVLANGAEMEFYPFC